MEGLGEALLSNGTNADPYLASSSPRLRFANPNTSIAIVSGTGIAMDFKFGFVRSRPSKF